LPVKRAIWAANQLRSKPYRWGGGHASFFDVGYDCSGTVSYALAAAGILQTPMSSSELVRFGNRGRGKWITIYARNGHAFAVIAGLRLDTTAWSNRSDREAPRWQVTFRSPRRLRAAPSRRALETEQPALTGRLPCCIVVSLPNEIAKPV
jgi:hypothetical protein